MKSSRGAFGERQNSHEVVKRREHDDVIKWRHFPRNWPFVRGIHRSPVKSPHKGQWRGALMFSLICVWINDWVNNRGAGDLRRYRAHYDVIVMECEMFYLVYCHQQETCSVTAIKQWLQPLIYCDNWTSFLPSPLLSTTSLKTIA